MKKRPFSTLILIFTIMVVAAACVQTTPTPSLDEQVQTAIAGTAAFQTAVGGAVQATVSALPPTPTPGPTVEVYELTEEELAALIDEAVAEAMVASEEAYSATSESTADGTVSDDEVYDTVYYVYAAEAAVYYAEELIEYYFELYGEYASEALDLLYAIEEDLSAIATSLAEIEAILEQGAAAATAALEQLNAAAQNAQTQVAEVQANIQGWSEKVQASIQAREQQVLSVGPNEIAGDLNGAITQAYDFLDAVKLAMEDRKVSQGELSQIAQLATNAKASLGQFGGPGSHRIVSGIDGLTRQVARGEWPAARGGLSGFEASLPQRPSPGSGPGGGLPGGGPRP